jgi:chromosome segregation ATPase
VSKLQGVTTAESEWKSKSSTLELQLDSTRDHLFQVEAEYKNLSGEKLKYERQAEANEKNTNEVKEQLDQATSTITATTRQLQHTQTELKDALRRAEDAEYLQRSLQTEGTNLMQSLDEMRPKIVELTSVRLDLSEKVETLESALRNRDLTISQLENDLNESRDNFEQRDEYWKNKVVQHERQVGNAERVSADIQNGYVELQDELNVLLASLRNLEAERSNNHQEASRHLQEIERLSHLTQIQEEQLDTLNHELEATRHSFVNFITYLDDTR